MPEASAPEHRDGRRLAGSIAPESRSRGTQRPAGTGTRRTWRWSLPVPAVLERPAIWMLEDANSFNYVDIWASAALLTGVSVLLYNMIAIAETAIRPGSRSGKRMPDREARRIRYG